MIKLFTAVCLVVVRIVSVPDALAAYDEIVGDTATKAFLVVGEELTYNVRYAFIDIGQVRIKVLEKIDENNEVRYKAIAYIDAYKGVPFVDLHAVYESIFDETVFATWFRARIKSNPSWTYVSYMFDYDNKRSLIEEGDFGTNVVSKRDTIPLDAKYQDGLSLFYFARKHVRTQQRHNVPTMIQKQKVNTYIDFKNQRVRENIDAVDYPVDVIHFAGRADFEGIFGLTGDFEGWFSNDDARVPIVAKMKVIIGDIRIELMKWNRTGWNPPRYVEPE